VIKRCAMLVWTITPGSRIRVVRRLPIVDRYPRYRLNAPQCWNTREAQTEEWIIVNFPNHVVFAN
jgi:hypothetical protein